VMGVNREIGLVRIYPIPFRQLEENRQFRKYQVLRLEVRKPRNDPRTNTFRPRLDSIELVGKPISSRDSWRARKEWLLPWANDSMCEIQRERKKTGLSMGVFKPVEVIGITQEPVKTPHWTKAEIAKLSQRDLFMTKEHNLLEKLPYTWRYRFTCSDPSCPGHHQGIIDWELGQLYRNLRRKRITDPDAVLAYVKRKFLDELCGPNRETYFFTGNMLKRPVTFLTLGVFWPPIEQQQTLF